jgi:hypothetical protein
VNADYDIGAKTKMMRTNYYLLSSFVAGLRSYFFANGHRSKNQNVGMLCACGIALVLLASAFTPNNVDAKVDENICKSMYDGYKESGEKKFREKYNFKYFVNDCIKLYKNPNWYFVGKNTIDKRYEKLQSLMGQTNEDKMVDLKTLSILSIGQEKFMIKFQACATKSSIQQPSFLLKSKIEQYVGLSNKVLQAGKCNSYVTQIKATQSSNIQVEYVSDLSKYPDIKSKLL